eukprot:1138925-Pelagomonas_calceolata.AAC.2
MHSNSAYMWLHESFFLTRCLKNVAILSRLPAVLNVLQSVSGFKGSVPKRLQEQGEPLSSCVPGSDHPKN